MDKSASNDTDRGNQWGEPSCDTAAKQFATCMGDNGGNIQTCQWYLDQLVGDFPLDSTRFSFVNHAIQENLPSNGKNLLSQDAENGVLEDQSATCIYGAVSA